MGSLCVQDSVKQGTTDIEFNREKGRGGGGGKSERKLKDTKKNRLTAMYNGRLGSDPSYRARVRSLNNCCSG